MMENTDGIDVAITGDVHVIVTGTEQAENNTALLMTRLLYNKVLNAFSIVTKRYAYESDNSERAAKSGEGYTGGDAAGDEA